MEEIVVAKAPDNIYSIVIKALDSRHYLAERHCIITDIDQRSRFLHQINKMDAHIEKLINIIDKRLA